MNKIQRHALIWTRDDRSETHGRYLQTHSYEPRMWEVLVKNEKFSIPKKTRRHAESNTHGAQRWKHVDLHTRARAVTSSTMASGTSRGSSFPVDCMDSFSS